MKIERLIGIIFYLINRECVTTNELAQKFEAQRIMIGRQANMEAKKALARRLCGIDPDGLF